DAWGAGGTPANNIPVAINVCNSTDDQDWIQWSDNRLSNGGLCLDITGADWLRGAKLELYWCNGQWNQNWVQKKSWIGSKPFVINPAAGHEGLCVDDPAFDTAPGRQLIDWYCSVGTNQQWELPGYNAASTSTGPTVTGYGPVGSGLSGECMDAYGSSNGASPGQVVAGHGCNGKPAPGGEGGAGGTGAARGLCLGTPGPGAGGGGPAYSA